jgi:hypothetical protein
VRLSIDRIIDPAETATDGDDHNFFRVLRSLLFRSPSIRLIPERLRASTSVFAILPPGGIGAHWRHSCKKRSARKGATRKFVTLAGRIWSAIAYHLIEHMQTSGKATANEPGAWQASGSSDVTGQYPQPGVRVSASPLALERRPPWRSLSAVTTTGAVFHSTHTAGRWRTAGKNPRKTLISAGDSLTKLLHGRGMKTLGNRGRGFIEPANHELTARLAVAGLIYPVVAHSPLRANTPSLFSSEESGPRAVQGALDAEQRGQQDIESACLDFLHGANVQIDQFGELFLRHIPCGVFAPNVRSELLQFRDSLFAERHARLRRENNLDGNGLLGRNLTQRDFRGVQDERG